ncbi:two-component regulator propeller domain-containing protein, partial [Spirosoma sp.]|uniref:two-component regulator propeller domain-containing protein n=1 Tax=Spirosoma sp. TaxID=1899569 RepID=UPI003B3A2C55
SKGKVTLLPPPATVLFVYQVHQRLWLQVIGKGLYELQNDRYVPVKGSEFLGDETVHCILPVDDKNMLIGTERAIYRYNGERFEPFNQLLNSFIRQNRLNRGTRIGADLYAFGTLLNGVVITDATGQIRYHFNQKNGLQNSTVLSMCQSDDGNLWVGLDKGINLINLALPVRYFTDTEGELGTFYDMARYDDTLYVGTNQGVYFKPLNRNEIPFQLIPETQGQVWDLTVVDNQLLCGHNKGTFRIKGNQARLICPVTGGWVLRRLKRHPDYLIQGTYTNLCVYRKDASGLWVFDHAVAGFSAPVRQLEEDDSGMIWVNKAPSQGIQRLRLSADLRRVETNRTYSDANFGGPALDLYRLQHRIAVTSSKGVLIYDNATDTFISARPTYSWAGLAIRKLFPMNESGVFILRQDGSLSWAKEGGQLVNDIPVKATHWAEESENVIALDSNYIAFCQENGFALLTRSELTQISTGTSPRPLIRMISVVDNPNIKYTFQQDSVPTALSFSYQQDNLLITFATPYSARPVKYSYWLENGTRDWSPYVATYQREFNNLPPGHYVFHLKSNLNPQESTIAFDIQPPWYWTGWSKLIYMALLAALIWLFYQLHLRRIAAQQKRMDEKLRRQEEQNQREIILLQKEQLEQGLIQKSEELANSTMSLIQKNELLVQLKEELDRLKSRSGNRVSTEDFQRINGLIDANISSEQDWKLFEANFNKVHEQFLKHLIENYPDLSQGDLKLAAYLRMNLSTKEIAQLLNITHRSVELKRYRLRKKLNLDADTNLSEFMMKY